MTTDSLIRALTITCLVGLLFGTGLRLTVGQLVDAFRRCKLVVLFVVNFVVVPALVVLVTRWFRLDPTLATGMLILAAAPFAPVVPIFARMARADLALAAGLTAVFPVFCAFLTPIVLGLALRGLPGSANVEFHTGTVLASLLATITLPLAAGVALNHRAPWFSLVVLRPVEVVGEVTGFASLVIIAATQREAVAPESWTPIVAMLLCCELTMLIGYFTGGPGRAMRRVIALGTSNRNIALALLVAVQSFSGTPIVAAVVTNGVLLLVMGLLHVAFWRFVQDRVRPAGHLASE